MAIRAPDGANKYIAAISLHSINITLGHSTEIPLALVFSDLTGRLLAFLTSNKASANRGRHIFNHIIFAKE